jgi:hypothetical protein
MELMRDNCGFIFISHNDIDIQRLATRVILLDKGQVVFEGPTIDGLRQFNSTLLPKVTQSFPVQIVASTEQISTGETVNYDITLPPDLSEVVIQTQVVSTIGPLGTFSSYMDNEVFCSSNRITLSLPEVPLLNGCYSIRFLFYTKSITGFLGEGPTQKLWIKNENMNAFGHGFAQYINFKHKWTKT